MCGTDDGYNRQALSFFLSFTRSDIFLFTEMLHSSAIVNGIQQLLDFDKSEHPVGLQLGGNEPKVLNQATKIASKFAYDEVNLNCGARAQGISRQFWSCVDENARSSC